MNDGLREGLDKLLEQMKTRPAGNPAPHRCKCQDLGMVEHGDGYRPCEKCNGAAYTRWRDGCFASGHHGCEKCRPSGRRSDRSEVFS